MRCADVRDCLLGDAPRRTAAVAEHLDVCTGCAAFAAEQRDLDRSLAAALFVTPPAALEARLLSLARGAAVAQAPAEQWSIAALVWPAAALAALGLAGWQIWSWLSLAAVEWGDLAWAAQVLVTMPTLGTFGTLGIDAFGLAFWSSVALGVWLALEPDTLTARFTTLRHAF